MTTKRTSAIYLLMFLAAWSGKAGATGTVSCDQAGPQTPRDIDRISGKNPVSFSKAPPAADLRLCDIHFHKNAEHRAAAFSKKMGTGDHAGFVCRGPAPTAKAQEGYGSAADGCRGIAEGDTVEVHWVFTSCDVEPGPGLGSCLGECVNPQLRVEARVFYLTDGEEGELDFARFSDVDNLTLPAAPGAVEFLGSTTGPSFNNEVCSAFQVSWNVGATCSPLAKASLDNWCQENVFEEDHAHGVRTLVTDPRLLSKIR